MREPESHENQLRHALVLLAQNSVERPNAALAQERTSQLHRHPFGLEVPECHIPGYATMARRIHYVGMVGITEISVRMMAFAIMDDIRHRMYGNPFVDYLRVIYVSTHQEHPENHDVYFEVGFPDQVVICGGCTDCSGEGGRGKREVEAIFTLLEMLSGVTRQTAFVQHGREMQLALGMEIYEAHHH